MEENVDVIEGKEEEDEDEEEDVEESDVDNEGEDGVGKTMGREFGGLESQREELPSDPNCSSSD